MTELKFPFTVICMDDKRRPVEIPPEKWVKEGRSYTALKAKPVMGGKAGFVLKEITLDESNYPYDCINVERFGIPSTDNAESEEAVNELIQESLLEEV